ncbi:pyridinium-3,5-bisthiocarboxylic acid mononucleotide nickel chelatase [Desulfovibrionales bacterium]
MVELFLDCAYGLGGDMFLALLADLGLDLAPLAVVFGVGRLDGLVRILAAEPLSRDGLAGRRLLVEPVAKQPLYCLSQIEAMVATLDISELTKARSFAVFHRLAEAEAHAHGIIKDHVHFHDIGVVDTVVDIVGAFWGLEQLGVARVTASVLPWFRGETIGIHGRLPLPAPATTFLLQGKPVQPTNFTHEAITPTGALLLDAIVAAWVPGPTGTVLAAGLAYGSLDTGGGLRGFLYEPLAAKTEAADDADGSVSGRRLEDVVVLESNIDHLTGEELGHCYSALLAAGALDVLYIPGMMKKNRPAGTFQVICRPEDLPVVESAFFANTLTLGIRRQRVERVVLERQPARLTTPFGEVAVKVAVLDGKAYPTPEYEALVQLAESTSRSVAQLRRMLGLADVPPV